MNVRTRFAPSPTGYLHVGGARTALFNWLFARHHGGDFVLRIEDTDDARNTEVARTAIFDGLAWLGLDWDEGPHKPGSHGPYNQSERRGIHDAWFQRLVDAGRVYPDAGAWRFRFKREQITMHDLVCGEVVIDYRDESNTPDMVVKRSDGSYVFHFVNVVDDLEMKITHVIRGEDHLMNTPKHLQLIEALAEPPPIYAHIPLILNPDGSKMSKRDAGAAVSEYPQRGFLPNAVLNFLALLGWSPKDDSEIFTPSELIDRFSLEAVNRAPARFDHEKCAWMNQQHLLGLEPAAFVKEAANFLLARTAQPLPEDFYAIATAVRQKVRLLEELPTAIDFLIGDEYPQDLEAVAKASTNPVIAHFRELAEQFESIEPWSGDAAKAALSNIAAAAGVKASQMLFPLRVALSGRGHGPDLNAMLDILGRNRTVARIRHFITCIDALRAE